MKYEVAAYWLLKNPFAANYCSHMLRLRIIVLVISCLLNSGETWNGYISCAALWESGTFMCICVNSELLFQVNSLSSTRSSMRPWHPSSQYAWWRSSSSSSTLVCRGCSRSTASSAPAPGLGSDHFLLTWGAPSYGIRGLDMTATSIGKTSW